MKRLQSTQSRNMNDTIMDESTAPPPASNDNRFYTNVPTSLSYEDMKHVIGKSGRHLHLLCDSTGVDKIWYNKGRRMFHVWGKRSCLEAASKALNAHMSKVIKRYKLTPEESIVYEEDVCVRGSLQGAIDPKHMMHLIGLKGRHFKHVTASSGVSYIWYDDQNHQIEIWGAPSSMSVAHEQLQCLLQSTYETIKKYSN